MPNKKAKKVSSRARTKSKTSSKKRYFGIVKIKKGVKMCWVAKEDKHGWGLALGLSNRNVWLTGLRFASREEVERVLEKNGIVFVHTRNSKTAPKD